MVLGSAEYSLQFLHRAKARHAQRVLEKWLANPSITRPFWHPLQLAAPKNCSCPWRIANLPGIPRVSRFLLRYRYERFHDPFHPPPHHRCPTCRSRRRPFRTCRVHPRQASTPNPQSFAPARSQSPPLGSHRRRLVRSVCTALAAHPFRHRS